MRSIILVLLSLITSVCCAQTATEKAFYSADSILITEEDICTPISLGNYEILFCENFPSNSNKYVKRITLEFDYSVLFSEAILVSSPFQNKRDIDFESIQLYLKNGDHINLCKNWFIEAKYYIALASLQDMVKKTSLSKIDYD